MSKLNNIKSTRNTTKSTTTQYEPKYEKYTNSIRNINTKQYKNSTIKINTTNTHEHVRYINTKYTYEKQDGNNNKNKQYDN